MPTPRNLQGLPIVTSISRYFPSFCLTLALASCAPKAPVVEETPAVKKEVPAVADETVSTAVPEMDLPTGPDNEIRVPGGMLNLPTDNEFRASNPQLPGPGSGSGGVFVRPPTDPPSRVKSAE
jgi:hypothetical protein